MSYNDYLGSDHWKSRRAIHFKNPANRICFICYTDKDLHVHHKTYKKLWKEKPRNLVTLCKVCHKETHRLLKRKISDKVTLNNAHRILKDKIKKAKNSGKNVRIKGFSYKIYIPKTKNQKKRERIEKLKREHPNKYRGLLPGYKNHKFSENNPNPNWTS